MIITLNLSGQLPVSPLLSSSGVLSYSFFCNIFLSLLILPNSVFISVC